MSHSVKPKEPAAIEEACRAVQKWLEREDDVGQALGGPGLTIEMREILDQIKAALGES